MPILSYVIVVLTIWTILSLRKTTKILVKLFEFELIFAGLTNLGYFFKGSNLTLSISDYFQIIQLFFSILTLISIGNRQGGKIWMRYVLFVFSIIISFGILAVWPFGEAVRTFDAGDRYSTDIAYISQYYHYVTIDTQAIKTLIRFICFATNATALTCVIKAEEWKNIVKGFFKMASICAFYTMAELLVINLIGYAGLDSVLRALFGDAPNHNLVRTGIHAACGFTAEPSQLSMIVFGIMTIFVLDSNKDNLKNSIGVSLWIYLIIPLLCGSFRIIGIIPIILLVYLIKKEANKKVIGYVTLISLSLCTLYLTGSLEYFVTRLSGALNFLTTGVVDYQSGEAGRLKTIVDAFAIFFKRPIFGIGPGTTFAYGFIPSMLVMFGCFGMMSWYYYMFGGIARIKSRRDIMILIVLSISWVYTNSISTGYSIVTLAIAYAFRFQKCNESDGQHLNSLINTSYHRGNH